MKLSSKSVLLALIGLTLVVVLSVDASLHEDDDSKAIKDHGERAVRKRAADDGGSDDGAQGKGKKGKKGKGKDASTTTTTTAAPSGTSTTTGKPGKKSSSSPSTTTTTTAKPGDNETTKAGDDDLDDYYMKKLIKDQSDEKAILSKLHQALNDWVAWLNAHNKKTLNKKKADRFIFLVKQVERKYRKKMITYPLQMREKGMFRSSDIS